MEWEFGEPMRVDLINKTLYIIDKYSNTVKKVEGVSSILIDTEDKYPIGIIRGNGSLYHVIKLKVTPEKYAVAIVKTRR